MIYEKNVGRVIFIDISLANLSLSTSRELVDVGDCDVNCGIDRDWSCDNGDECGDDCDDECCDKRDVGNGSSWLSVYSWSLAEIGRAHV